MEQTAVVAAFFDPALHPARSPHRTQREGRLEGRPSLSSLRCDQLGLEFLSPSCLGAFSCSCWGWVSVFSGGARLLRDFALLTLLLPLPQAFATLLVVVLAHGELPFVVPGIGRG
jgi:hypothetical protein